MEAPLGQRGWENLFCFVALLFFCSLLPLLSSNFNTSQMLKLQGRFDQRNCGPKSGEHQGYPCYSFPSLLSLHLAPEEDTVTGSLLQSRETKALAV